MFLIKDDEVQSEDFVYGQPQYFQPEEEEEERSQWPFLSRQSASTFLSSPYYRQRRSIVEKIGVIEECCYKPCSLKELQTYCASSP